jgi:seryl-tRNA synthetase
MNPNQLLRKEIEVVSKSNQKRAVDIPLEGYVEMEQRRKSLQSETESCQMQVNQLSKDISVLKRAGKDAQELLSQVTEVSKKKKVLESDLKALLVSMRSFELSVPNILDDRVPLGNSEADNQLVDEFGKPEVFGFTPKSHMELAGDDLDFQRAAKLSGARFVFMRGRIARLHRSLAQWMLDEQIEQGYEEINPPLLVSQAALYGTSQLPKFEEDQFYTLDKVHALIPTAEVCVTNLYRDEIIKKVPQSFVALTPCFRSEAGSYGKDTQGMMRLHQFEKVELVKFTDEASAEIEFQKLVSDCENILKKLNLPYRKVLLCSKDTGFGSKITYDLEVWLPGENAYREISSCSYFGDFQARRMQARYRSEDGVKLLHTMNGSGLAVGRALIALMENYQTKDGKIRIPEVLKPYMGSDEI